MSIYKSAANYFSTQERRPVLEKLLADKIYENALAELKQMAVDKGYTQEWLDKEIVQLNKNILSHAEKALAEYNVRIAALEKQYEQAKNSNYAYGYTAADYADLQFLQTLIKTRIINESQEQPVLTERILNDYINTPQGARAIMFLANDSEIGTQMKRYYSTAAANAQSEDERQFNAAKQAKLDNLGADIITMMQNAVIGGAYVQAARERVQANEITRVNSIYWGNTEGVNNAWIG